MSKLYFYLTVLFVACSQLLPMTSFGREIATSKTMVEKPGTSGSVGISNSTMLNPLTGSLDSYLTDSQGISLYMFAADSFNTSNCYGECAKIWPPLVVASQNNIQVTGNVIGGLIGTIPRQDGSLQVTYNGMPLYYYTKDNVAGNITGQGIFDFGAVWYLVRPEGHAIE